MELENDLIAQRRDKNGGFAQRGIEFMAMKSQLLLSCCLWLTINLGLTAQIPSSTPTPLPSSSDELITEIANKEHNNERSRHAIEAAGRLQRPDAMLVGLAHSDYDVRYSALQTLKSFPSSEQRAILASALRNDEIWKEQQGGERLAGQHVYFLTIVAALKELGVSASERDFLDAQARHRIADALAASTNTSKSK